MVDGLSDGEAQDGHQPASPGRLGPGRVVLIVGPSGAGKDTLIGLARARLGPPSRVVFPKRIVTRAASADEDNSVVSPEQFEADASRGRYALAWRAHGLNYAISKQIDADVEGGFTVVLNVSRAVIATARARYARVSVAYIDAPPEQRAARLAARGRETTDDVRARLARAPDGFDPRDADVFILNDSAPGPAADRLYTLLILS